MVSLTFTDPVNLWFSLTIPLFILIHFFTLKFTRQKAFKFANFEAIRRITGGQVLSKNISLLVVRLFIITCFILAVSGAIFNYTGQGTNFRFVLGIDASSSMTANDILPTRLDAAKEAAKIFVDEIGSKTYVGILSFAGSSLILQSITETTANIKNAIDEVQVLPIGGTDISEAMITAANMFKILGEEMEGSNAIILLTDGRANVGLSLDQAIQYINDLNLMVHTIGVGTPEGGAIKGTNVTLKIDQEGLQNIAARTGGQYHRAKNNEELIQAYKDIAQMNETKISIHLRTPLLILGLILLVVEWGLINTKFRTLP